MRPGTFSINPYEVLGVAPDASSEEIQLAYHQHALRWHPDRNPNDEYALRMMQRVNAAWTILKDEHSRAAYDRWERGETRTASGPEAWRRPQSGSTPGGEWYRPPGQKSTACPRCPTINEPDSVFCYSCGFPLDEASSPTDSSRGEYEPQHHAYAQAVANRPGGFWIRLVAFIVDWIIVFALSAAVASAVGISVADWWSESWTSDGFSLGAFDWISIAIDTAYFTAFVAAWSATIGKLMFGLEVVRKDGTKVGIFRAFFRTLCYNISLLILGIGFLMIAFRRDKRGLHDLICDTKVVYP